MQKTVGDTSRFYVYGLDGKLLAELDGDGTPIVEYAYLNGQPLAMWREEGV